MKQFLIFLLFFATILTTPSMVSARAGTQSGASDDHTAREEKEGKEIWEKLQVKKLLCKNLTDSNFESLGEYFMGQMAGDTEKHAAMNQMMKSMMGDNAEEQMHIALGKRKSGCGYNFIPMMNMMMAP